MRPSIRAFVAFISETTWMRIYIKAGIGALQGILSMQLKVYLPIF
jgi:hypothetical protein